MKCSDCKYYQTENCKLKPEAEYFVAEGFDCFEFDGSKAECRQQTAVPLKSNKKGGHWGLNIGVILVWVGIAGIFVSIFVIFGGCGSAADNDDYGVLQLIFGLGVLVLSICIIAAGAFGLWAESLGEKEQKKDRKGDDSQNKAMRENFERLLLELKHSNKTDKP